MLVCLEVVGLHRESAASSVVFVRHFTLGYQSSFEGAEFIHVARLAAIHGVSLGPLMENLIGLVL